MRIREIALKLAEFGVPEIGEGQLIPDGLSFKQPQPDRLWLTLMQGQEKLTIFLDQDTPGHAVVGEVRIVRAERLWDVPGAPQVDE